MQRHTPGFYCTVCKQKPDIYLCNCSGCDRLIWHSADSNSGPLTLPSLSLTTWPQHLFYISFSARVLAQTFRLENISARVLAQPFRLENISARVLAQPFWLENISARVLAQPFRLENVSAWFGGGGS